MTPQEAIALNAQLVIKQLGPTSDLGTRFGYNRESVEWVQGFIERQRARPEFAPEQARKLTQVLGSFLGECIIRVFGGQWRQEKDGEWGVFFNDSNAAFPFAKVGKQFDNGVEGGDSILGLFDLIGPVLLKKPPTG